MILVAAGGSRERGDWQAERERIDLASVATNLLGPAPGRRGERGLWWRCPLGTHRDDNPSFKVFRDGSGRWRWKCFGCNEGGDAAALVMKVKHCTFPEARTYMTGGPTPPGKPRSPRVTAPNPEKTPRPETDPRPAGMIVAEALSLIVEGERRLWTPEGEAARSYLTGPRRLLRPETIRNLRLGYTPGIAARTRDGHRYKAQGIVIPWFAGGVPTLIKLRQPEGRRPKYVEVFRNADRPPLIYPAPEAIRPDRPLIIPEGEFDSALLAQELGELAGVVTPGSASTPITAAILGALWLAAPWYVATDADDAGERAASAWLSCPRARRLRPPAPFKDWTEAVGSPEGSKDCGMDLRRWWGAILAGDPSPPTFTWDELARWRWGPALDDPEPGIIIDRPDRARMMAALEILNGGPGAP